MELRILAGKSPWVLPNASGTGPLDSKLQTLTAGDPNAGTLTSTMHTQVLSAFVPDDEAPNRSLQ